MKRLLEKIALACCVLSLALAFQACEQEGPAEKAGEKVDTMIEDTKEGLKEAGDKTGEMVEKGGEELEKAGEKMQE
jgi:hypothetical protein